MKCALPFQLSVVGDGESSTLQVNLRSAPFVLPNGHPLPPDDPSDVYNVTATSEQVKSASIQNRALVVEFEDAVAKDLAITISGSFLY